MKRILPLGDQRNIFRQAAQKRVDISVRKQFKVSDRLNIQYGFNVFNLFNTTSMDVPQNNTQLGQGGACGTKYASTYDCANDYELYGMVITDQTDQAGPTIGPAGGGSAGTNLYELPYTNGTSGKNTVVPTTIPVTSPATHGCTTSTEALVGQRRLLCK